MHINRASLPDACTTAPGAVLLCVRVRVWVGVCVCVYVCVCTPTQQQSIIGEREGECVCTHRDADTDPHKKNPSSARANMLFPPPSQAVSAHVNGLNNFALAVEVNDG